MLETDVELLPVEGVNGIEDRPNKQTPPFLFHDLNVNGSSISIWAAVAVLYQHQRPLQNNLAGFGDDGYLDDDLTGIPNSSRKVGRYG